MMFKKLNNRLLTRWPLIWNTRAIWVIGSLLVLHLLFYLLGRSCYTDVTELGSGYYNRLSDVYNLGILVSFLVLVLWLIFYFRNNALKSLYPVTRWYLFREYAIVLLTCMLNCTLLISSHAGYRDAVLADTRDFDLGKDSETINTAAQFIPNTWEEFERSNSCDSIRARESATQVDINDPSLETIEWCDMPMEELDEEYNDTATYAEPPKKILEYNYLYYCQKPAFYDSADQFFYHSKAERWLRGHHADSIRNSLVEYVKLSYRYKAYSTLDIDFWVNCCFRDSNFALVTTLETYNNNLRSNQSHQSTNYYAITSTMNTIDSYRTNGIMHADIYFVYLYIGLVMSLAIFSFRLTRLRTWIMSLIGGVLWAIILMFASHNGRFEGLAQTVFVLCALFLVGFVVLITGKKFKTIAALCFCWFMAMFLLVTPFVFGYIYQHTHEERACIDHKMTVIYPEPPIHDWINDNWVTINTGNMVLMVILVFFLLIPMAIRWQSNPEE